MTKEVNIFLEAKQCTLQTDDRIPLKMAQAELKAYARKCKQDYRNKMQAIFKQNNTKQAWHSVKPILGCNNSNKICYVSNSTEFANDINTFYCRFDCRDFEAERNCAGQYVKLRPGHTFDTSNDDAVLLSKRKLTKLLVLTK